MSGRGDNNKKGSSGRGANNQSNQAFVPDGEKEPKSDHGKQTGGTPSKKQEATQSQDANRDTSTDKQNK
jgi:hypothetical protein